MPMFNGISVLNCIFWYDCICSIDLFFFLPVEYTSNVNSLDACICRRNEVRNNADAHAYTDFVWCVQLFDYFSTRSPNASYTPFAIIWTVCVSVVFFFCFFWLLWFSCFPSTSLATCFSLSISVLHQFEANANVCKHMNSLLNILSAAVVPRNIVFISISEWMEGKETEERKKRNESERERERE